MEGSIDVLLQRGADPNTSDIPLPPIVYAICAGDVNGVIRLLAKGARVHSTLTHEVSPVRNKIKMGRVEGREEGREREKVEGREEGRGGGRGGRGGGREEGEEGGKTYILFSSRHSWEAARC